MEEGLETNLKVPFTSWRVQNIYGTEIKLNVVLKLFECVAEI